VRWTTPARLRPANTAPPGRPAVLPPGKRYTGRIDVPCRLYWIYVWDPRTNFTTLTLGYVGETSRTDPIKRFREHVGNGTPSCPGQPWSDTIPTHDPYEALAQGVLVISTEVYPSKTAAWAAEELAVLRDRPLYNHEYNLGNPDRITIYDARQARAERDLAAGVPLAESWAVLHEQHDRVPANAGTPERQRVPESSPRPRRRMTRAGKKRAGWAAAWLVPTIAGWWLLAHYAAVVSTWRLGGVSGVLVGELLLWWTRPRGPWRRASHQALRIALLGVLGLLLWPAVRAFLGGT
jgi:hypothetical protein